MANDKLKVFQPRRHHRFPKQVEVIVCIKEDCITLITKDISDGGIAFSINPSIVLPKMGKGSFVRIRAKGEMESSARIAKVVRLDENELAIEFV